jgi:branched-chain amino acid transport system substrate-binding protein
MSSERDSGRISRRGFLGTAALGSAAIAAPSILVGCKKGGSDTIQLGAILGLSGEDASLGNETKDGIAMALDEVNAAGGVKGKKLAVAYEDTKLDPTLASEKIQKLIDRDKCLVVLGDAGSTPTLSARNYAEKAKVPLVTPSATNVDVTKGARWVFRVCFTDATQGAAAAKFAREGLKADKAAIIYATGNKYSEGLQAIFKEEFEKRGGKVVKIATYQMGETNIVSFLTEIKDADPQFIFAPVYPSDLSKIGPTKQQIGLKAPLMGTDGWDGPATRQKGVIETLEGSYFTNLFAADQPGSKAKDFVEAHKKRFGGRVPSSLTACGYDAFKLVVDAISRAKEITPDAIRDALEATKGYSGVTGTFDIDAGHNATKPVPVMKITAGDFKYDSMVSL